MSHNEQSDYQNSRPILYQCKNCLAYLMSINSCNKHSKTCRFSKDDSSPLSTASLCFPDFQMVSFPVPRLTLSRLNSRHRPSAPHLGPEEHSIKNKVKSEVDLEGISHSIKDEPNDHIIRNENYLGKLEYAVGWHIEEDVEEYEHDDHFNDYSDSLKGLSNNNQNSLTESDNLVSASGNGSQDYGANQKDTRLARKRAQNRRAARFYRQKIQLEINDLCSQETEWEEKNKLLKKEKEELSREIRTIKNLLLEKLRQKTSHRHLVQVEMEEDEPNRFGHISPLISTAIRGATSSIIIQTSEPIILPNKRRRKQNLKITNEDNEKTSGFDEIIMRRRETNRQAVFRFRQKRREEMLIIQDEIDSLEVDNMELEIKMDDLRKQINFVKKLIREKMRNRKKLKRNILICEKLLSADQKSSVTLNLLKKKRI